MTEKLFYFLIYAMIGWVAEVVYAALKKGEFVNRGYLSGPYCPIYGFGASFVIMLLFDLKDNKLLLFFGSIAIATVLELVVGFILDKALHQRLWNYNDEPFNIGGYVCPSMSVLWGVACVFVVDYLHVLIMNFYNFLPEVLNLWFVVIGFATIAVDTIISTNKILKLNKNLKRLHEISDRLKWISDEVGAHIAEATIEIDGSLKETNARIVVKNAERRALLSERMELINENIKRSRRLLRAHPKWNQNNFLEEMNDLKNEFRERFNKNKRM